MVNPLKRVAVSLDRTDGEARVLRRVGARYHRQAVVAVNTLRVRLARGDHVEQRHGGGVLGLGDEKGRRNAVRGRGRRRWGRGGG